MVVAAAKRLKEDMVAEVVEKPALLRLLQLRALFKHMIRASATTDSNTHQTRPSMKSVTLEALRKLRLI